MITYNKAAFLKRSVPAIYSSLSGTADVEFLLLNNGSTDSTEDVIRGLSQRYPIDVMRIKKNIGLNGYSVVTEEARGKIIVTADDDIFYVSRDWESCFDTLLRTRFDGRMLGYVGSDTINSDGGRSDIMLGIASTKSYTVEIGPVGGWFAATRREILDEIGGFHSGMPEMYLEDSDFQRRAWQVGYICGTSKDVKVYHARAPKYYKELGCEATYIEKIGLAQQVGIEIEPLV